MIIKVTIGTNTERKEITVDNTKTIKDVLTDNGVNYTSCVVHLDGVPLGVSDLNSSFASLNITDSCSLLAVVKASNA
jgi:sulfur carrier protein ThiS